MVLLGEVFPNFSADTNEGNQNKKVKLNELNKQRSISLKVKFNFMILSVIRKLIRRIKPFF